MGRLLGIDFGQVRIGLAISDERKRIALPIGIIRAGKDDRATIGSLQQHTERYRDVEGVVIGLPLEFSGKEGAMAQRVRLFAQILQEVTSLPVLFWDERLTSAQVERSLKETGMRRKERAAHSDEMAATAILQNYLDALNR
jgi:putative Holliday junction resolvase